MDLSNSELCGDCSLHDKDSRTSLDSGISMDAVSFKVKSLGKENDLFSEEYLRRMSILQKLAKEEEQLKIAITYATRGLLATDHVILNHGQVTWTTPELAPPSPNYHTNLEGIFYQYLVGKFFEIHSSKIYGSTGSMMSILAAKENSFAADMRFQQIAKIIIFVPKKIVHVKI
ncbi:hypothetical protein TNCV_2305441 [Trichonephila clavipes]|nr:hypothetical protein TNCV_2305441 [Trichonephila clavipes]